MPHHVKTPFAAVTVLVRGDKCTGKTSLIKLLGGGWYDPEYKASKPRDTEKVSVEWAAGRECHTHTKKNPCLVEIQWYTRQPCIACDA
jgi:hypothetical protein